MRRKVDLTWNVLLHEFNTDSIITYNVLNDDYIIDTMVKLVKKKTITTYTELKEYLSGKFRARYMSRAEYEILVSGLFDKSKAKKIDVWQQIEMNLDNIVEYLVYKMKLDLINK